MFAKPLTGTVSPVVVALILTATPVHASEHLIQAWDALAAAERGESPEANRAFAANRLACARAVGHGVKPRKRAAYVAECASLEAALAA